MLPVSPAAFAQSSNCTIEVKVMDDRTDLALPGSSVKLKEINTRQPLNDSTLATTGPNGITKLSALTARTYIVQAWNNDTTHGQCPFFLSGEAVDVPNTKDTTIKVTFRLKRQTDCNGLSIHIDNTFFSSRSAVITASQDGNLDALAAVLLDNPGITIEITGYADCHEFNSDSLNLKLAARRAEIITQYLSRRQVDPAMIKQSAKIITQHKGNYSCGKTTTCPESEQKANRYAGYKIVKD